MPVLNEERLVKCPTEHCPGWITLDETRPQTIPCRYCRITTHTLAYLLGQIGEREAPSGFLDLWSPGLHERFNDLMLRMAGAANNNVYLRAMDRALVSRVTGQHGVALEYNPEIAGIAGPAPMVGLLLHELLHFDLHSGEERPLQLTFKPNARDKEFLAGPLGHLGILNDHVWLPARMDEIDPLLRPVLEEWGFDVALMMAGGESFFLPYISERNRRWLADTIQQPGIQAGTIREQIVDRLAQLTARFFGQERELLRRTLLIVQLAELKLTSPESAERYAAQLARHEMPGHQEAVTAAQRLRDELVEVRESAPARPTTTDFRRSLETAVRVLGLQNVVEVFGQKAK